MLPRAHVVSRLPSRTTQRPLDNSPVISMPKLSCKAGRTEFTSLGRPARFGSSNATLDVKGGGKPASERAGGLG